MDLMWIFLILLLTAYIFLNVMGTGMIKASELHDHNQKTKMIIMLWALPLVGVFMVIRQINKDIKQNQSKIEEEIAPAIREVADRLKVLDADLSRSKLNSSDNQNTGKNIKIH